MENNGNELFSLAVSEFEIHDEAIAELAQVKGVPLAPGINISDLVGPNGQAPFLFDLPILEFGENFKSRNGRPWRLAGAQNLVNTIMETRLEGQLGHIRPQDRAHDYTLPAVWWVGAEIVGDETGGKVLGKALVPFSRPDVRDYFRTADKIKAPVGVSVYGMPGKAGTDDASFESIDIGHHRRLGIASIAASPFIVSELEENAQMETTTEATVVTPPARPIQEVLDEALASLVAPISELLTLPNASPAEMITALVNEVRNARHQVVVAEFADYVRTSYTTRGVAEYIMEFIDADEIQTLDDAKARVEKLVKKPNIAKTIAEMVAEAGGPRVAGGEKDKTPEAGTVSRFDPKMFTKEYVAEIMQADGFTGF